MSMKLRTIQFSSSLRSRPWMKVGIRAGTSVIERSATPIMAKLLVKASGWNSLPSRPREQNTGMNDSSMISTEKKIGRPTVRQAGMTSSRVSPVTFCVAEMRRQVVRGVLDHHDRLIDQDADRDGDAGQRHDVGLDVDDAELPQHPHQEEREQHRQRQRHADHERAAEVHQDQQDRERGDDHLVPHDFGERVDGAVDQPRAVVGGDDAHALGQARLQLLDLLLDALGDAPADSRRAASAPRRRSTSLPSFSNTLRRNCGPSCTVATVVT